MLKLVQERPGNTLGFIGIGNDLLNRTQRAQHLRDRIDKWDYMKLKSFCTTKEMVTRLKSSPQNGRKPWPALHLKNGLITRMYRELKKLNYQKINDPMKKWTNVLNRGFSKEEVQMARIHMKKCSTSLATWEMQIKITLGFHLLLEWLSSRTQTTINVGEDVGKKELSYIVET
jgi:hypothetical protein